MPKILVILIPGFPENEQDTTCLPLQQALVHTIKMNHPDVEPIILALEYPFKKGIYQWNGVEVHAFGGRNRGKFFRLFNWIKVWRALRKINQTYEVTGILSFWIDECAFLGERFARANNLKHYCWVLGQDARPFNSYVKLSGMEDKSFVAMSDFLAHNLKVNYNIVPEQVIPGGIDEGLFTDTAIERDIDVLGAGSLITLKQFNLFIEVICRLRRRIPNVKAVICGEGPDRARLERMITKLKMEKHITLKGQLPYAEVLKLMQRSKVLLHTSSYEGYGMVSAEALAAGAKVVTLLHVMNHRIENWQVAETTYEAGEIITDILQNEAMAYYPVVLFKIEDTAASFMKLYTDEAAVISLNRFAIAPKESVAL